MLPAVSIAKVRPVVSGSAGPEHSRPILESMDDSMERTDWLDKDGVDPNWDEAFADEILGTLVLLGITHRQPDGTVTKEEQFHGYVKSVDQRRGITIKLEGDDVREEINLPPMLEVFERAEPGIYTDRTGNAVRDPDFIAYWTVTSGTS